MTTTLAAAVDRELAAAFDAWGWRPRHFRPREFFGWAFRAPTAESRPFFEAVECGGVPVSFGSRDEWRRMWQRMEAVGVAADALRDELGPLAVTPAGGVRFPEVFPRKYAETPGSRHFIGDALDLRPLAKGVTARDIYEVADALQRQGAIQAGGAHAYPSGFCHIDVRGKRARW
jgi:hypothetical protein